MLKNTLICLLLTFLLVNSAHAADSRQQANSVKTTSDTSFPSAIFWQGSSFAIWNQLQQTPVQKLKNQSSDANTTEDTWIELALISKVYNHDSKRLAQELLAWRYKHSDHPGNQLFNDNALAEITNSATPRHIALLLPLTGPLSTSGQAVRDGFLEAYYQALSTSHDKQTISFYDTSANRNISNLYQQAITNGADTVIGPLTKDEVQNLISTATVTVPTLALNYTDGSLPTNFYEFGLSPVDEAHQMAEKAQSSGLTHAIIIAPQNSWGQRVAKSITSHWQAVGGQVVDTLYFSKDTDFNQAIAHLLRINISADRKKMRENNNKVALEQQRRQDVDVIFLLAEPDAGREIVPILKFYYAERIPIYATSTIYSGSANPQKDKDLNGVIFADIPWLIKSSHNTNRLYAVGHDAYVISAELSRLTQLPHFPLYAATGALTFNSNHQIYRRLPWAQIHNGHP